MPSAQTSMNYPTPTPWAVHQALGERRKAAPAQQAKAIAIPARRGFDRVTVGIFVGGLLLGPAGCILGAVMPHRHPVGMTISVLWWGFYCGCLGASIGALIGQFTRRAATAPSSALDSDAASVLTVIIGRAQPAEAETAVIAVRNSTRWR
jgi:hypothetical protein